MDTSMVELAKEFKLVVPDPIEDFLAKATPRTPTPIKACFEESPVCITEGCDNMSYAEGLCSECHPHANIHGGKPRWHHMEVLRGYCVSAKLSRYAEHPEVGNCWHWTRALQATGHARFDCVAFNSTLVHRATYQLAYGIKDMIDKHVMHICDVRSCIRPKHLFVGDNDMNQRDAALKGRTRSKLSDEDVFNIHKEYLRGKGGVSQAALAKKYGTHQGNICRHLNGELRSHIKREFDKQWKIIFEGSTVTHRSI